MPTLRGGRYLYGRVDPGAKGESVLEFDPTTGHERVVLDLSKVEPVARYWFASSDGTHIVVLVAPNSGDELSARVFDTRTSRWLPDEVPGFHYGFPDWSKDGSGFYYTWSPPPSGTLTAGQRAGFSQLRYHRLGGDPARDVIVRPATGVDGTYEIPGTSPDGNWLLAVRILGPAGRAPFLAALRRDASAHDWISLVTPTRDVAYDVAFGKHEFFVVTDEDAPRRRAFRGDLRHPLRAEWHEIQAQRPTATLSRVSTVDDFVFFQYEEDGETQFEIRRVNGDLVKTLSAPAGGALTNLETGLDSKEAVVAVTSHASPDRVYKLRAPAFDLVPFPAGAQGVEDSGAYVTERTYFTSPDGTRSHIFIVRARSTPPRSNAPLILYAYGAFGYSLEPHYNRGLQVWLDRGGVYAEAIVRGGGEYGSDWHHAGMGKNRKNVYDDFLAASESLVNEGWTSPDRFLIRGVSAGGLLVAVAETEKPSLFRGVIAEVPMSDMIRYPLGHDSGTLWLDEYGSPSKLDEFETLYRYSPYHRVRRGTRYPATLILASEHDQRLDPMHGRKLAAVLDDAEPCNTVLLRVEHDGGHSGPTRGSDWLEEAADLYTFAAGLVGMTK